MRIRPWQWTALDYVLGALTAGFLFAAASPIPQAIAVPPPGVLRYYHLPAAGPLVLFLVVATAGVAVALRRRHPVIMLGVLLADSVLLAAMVRRPAISLAFFIPVTYVLYLIAASYERRRDAVRVLVVVFSVLLLDTELTALTDGTVNQVFTSGKLFSVSLCVIIVWTVGYTVRQRRRYAVRLQEEAASKAVAEERLRIARELHDVVAHSMSVIAVQAGYGQYVIDTQPADARSALGAIQVTSREALDEMRRMLGALRHAVEADQQRGGPEAPAAEAPPADAAGAPLFPAPGLADLDRLLSRTASAGVRVDVKRLGQQVDLPASIDLSAYRIIQEALTNVVKHAHTNSCQVLIGYGQDELLVEITDNGAGLPALAGAGARAMVPALDRGSLYGGSLYGGSLNGVPHNGVPRNAGAPDHGSYDAQGFGGEPGGGHGIIGMRERVSLLGGVFNAGPLPGYGFRVSARIPLRAGEAR
jgi:signal transduction histidine kinase